MLEDKISPTLQNESVITGPVILEANIINPKAVVWKISRLFNFNPDLSPLPFHPAEAYLKAKEDFNKRKINKVNIWGFATKESEART